MLNVTEKDLKNEITDMQERYPHLQRTELFVAWFLKCFVTEKEEDDSGAGFCWPFFPSVLGADHQWRYWRRHRSARQSPSETEGPSRSSSSGREPADVAVVMGRRPIARASP